MNSKKSRNRIIVVLLILLSITCVIAWSIWNAKKELNMLNSWNKGAIVKLTNDAGGLIVHYSFLDTIEMSNYWSESSLVNYGAGKTISLGDSILVSYSSENPEISIPFLIDEIRNGQELQEIVKSKNPCDLMSIWDYISL